MKRVLSLLLCAGTLFFPAIPESAQAARSPENVSIVTVVPYDVTAYDNSISKFIENRSGSQNKLFESALLFLGAPYSLEPLGEGVGGEYSEEPLYRTDRFDCVSYVNTVLSLAHSSNLTQFRQNMINVRYAGLRQEYIHRTDWFTDLEWIPNIQRLGWIVDVTWKIVDRQQQPIALMAKTLIDKPNWYVKRPLNAIHRLDPLLTKNQKVLDTLHQQSKKFSVQSSSLSYLPLNRLFDAEGRPDPRLFQQIPSGSIIFIVRPNWNIRDDFNHSPGYPSGYGTNLNVSHIGFAFRTEAGLEFCNSSSLHGKVICESLTTYLHKYLNSPTVKGIHVEKVV